MTFKDVAVPFNQDEWGQLDTAQRTLYWEVLLETCGLLASLGEASLLLLWGPPASFILPFVQKAFKDTLPLPCSPDECSFHFLLPSLLCLPQGIWGWKPVSPQNSQMPKD